MCDRLATTALEGATAVTRTYAILALAIVAEVIATTALARSESFTRLWPSVITVVSYAIAFWLLSFPLRVLPTGVVYAIWSGMGIVLISAVAWIWFRQTLDAPALIGLGLILAGVLVVNLFSKSLPH
jgi:small multidrug resistance pump